MSEIPTTINKWVQLIQQHMINEKHRINEEEKE